MNEFNEKTINLIQNRVEKIISSVGNYPKEERKNVKKIIEEGFDLIERFKEPVNEKKQIEDQLEVADQKFEDYEDWMLKAQAIH